MFGMAQTVDFNRDQTEPTTSGFEEDEILAFVNEWLGAIADYSIGVLVTQFLQIEKFSPSGRDQLKVDLEYLRFDFFREALITILSNVITALGLKQHPICNHLLFLLKQDPNKLLTQIEFIPGKHFSFLI
jgi:hypothetical protein